VEEYALVMQSIFSKVPVARASTVYDQIGPEIVHLQKGTSVRDRAEARNKKGAWIATIAICILLGLFFMDPFLYAMHKSSAIKAYLYLHNYDSDSSTKALEDSQMFTRDEIESMKSLHGSYLSYFSTPVDAEKTAASAVSFMSGVHALHNGDYANLDPVGKLRYMLFVRLGLYPPVAWKGLNPPVE
jgi:hypothetical protein